MIESRIKRALWVVSILIALGFGGHSAYEFRQEAASERHFQYWVAKSSERRKECDKRTEEVRAKAGAAADWEISNASITCNPTRFNELDEGVSRTATATSEAAYAAQQSLAIAVVCPIALWTLFFLLRWIWTGRTGVPQSLEKGKRPFFTKQVLYWALGILGCVFLFAVNVLVLPSGRALQVLISSVVQGTGLVLLVWIVNKVRETRRKRAEQERAVQPVASVNPSQESSG